MNWLRRLLSPRQRGFDHPLPEPFPQGYTLERWQASETMPLAAQKLFSEELFRHMLAVLYNGIPFGYPARGQTVNDTMANIELGRYQGYMDCLNLLQSLAVVPTPEPDRELDFNAEPTD